MPQEDKVIGDNGVYLFEANREVEERKKDKGSEACCILLYKIHAEPQL